MKALGIVLIVIACFFATVNILNPLFGINIDPIMKYYDFSTLYFVWEHILVIFGAGIYVLFKPNKGQQG